MKMDVNLKTITGIVEKINWVLFVSACGLAVYLTLSMARPYYPLKFQRTPYSLGLLESENKKDTQKMGVSHFDETLFYTRNLFQYAEKEELERKEQGMPVSFELLGTAVVGESKTAVLKDVKGEREYYCMEGDVIGNFKVQKIMSDRVILESQGTITEVTR